MRERGWILREGTTYHLWFTGYDGTRDGLKMLGYATSPDGIHWTRYPHNPIYRDHWVEDMMVVKHGDTYYMFAEGLDDHAQLLTSPDKIHWTWRGFLDIRTADGKPISKGPYGTPTAWFENGRWHLFYERGDRAVWLAESKDLKVFTNVQDDAGARSRAGRIRPAIRGAQPDHQIQGPLLRLLPRFARRTAARLLVE